MNLTEEQLRQLTNNLAVLDARRLQGLQEEVARAEQGSIMTRAGLDILMRGVAGEKIIYTRAALGDSLRNNQLVEVTDEQILDMTGLINWRMDLPLADVTFANNGTMVVKAVLQNSAWQNGSWARELGLFAKIEGDAQDVLYSYRNTGALSAYVPSGQGAVLLNLILNLVTVVDNATNIYAVLDASLLYVNQSQFISHINDTLPHPNIPNLKAKVTTTPQIWATNLDNQLHPMQTDDLFEQFVVSPSSPITRMENRLTQNETNVANLYMQLDSVQDGGLDANLFIFEDFQDCEVVDLLKTKVLQTAGGPNDIYVESLDGILVGHYYTLSDGNRSQFLRVQSLNSNDGLYNVMFESAVPSTFNLAKAYLYRTTSKIKTSMSGSGDEHETKFAPDISWSGIASSTTKTINLKTTQANTSNFELSGSAAFDANGFFTLA